ncbi:MAG: hypothetical protein LBI72_03270 [Flavobacteriaceae bacterium]|jgi:hypothetical protein|nr:hypothetical protein [Flavobacteriaceae bacterium]
MARVNQKNQLTGLIGGIYSKQHRGKQIWQTKPDRSNQDKSKNVNAILMKKASHDSSFIRKRVENLLNSRQDSYMHSRFLGKLMSTLHKEDKITIAEKTIFSVDCYNLKGFEFNNKVLFKEIVLSNIEVNEINKGELHVMIPSFKPNEQIIFPKGCTEALIRLSAFTLCNTLEIYHQKNIHDFTIEFTKEDHLVEEINWVCPTIEHSEKFEIIVADILFFYPINSLNKRLTLYNNKMYNPSMVIYAK